MNRQSCYPWQTLVFSLGLLGLTAPRITAWREMRQPAAGAKEKLNPGFRPAIVIREDGQRVGAGGEPPPAPWGIYQNDNLTLNILNPVKSISMKAGKETP